MVSSDDKSKAYKSNAAQALALEYVKIHITAEMSPEEVARLYMETYKRISDVTSRG